MKTMLCLILSFVSAVNTLWAAPSNGAAETLQDIQALEAQPASPNLAKQVGGSSVRCHKENYYPYDTVCTEESEQRGAGGSAGLSTVGFIVCLGLLGLLIWSVVATPSS